MGVLSKLFGGADEKNYENTHYSGMWVCPNCDVALTDEIINELDDACAWYCCPACGHNHKDTTFKKKVEKEG